MAAPAAAGRRRARAAQIFVLGCLAGAYIGFGALLMVCVGGSCFGLAASNPGLKAIISGLFGLPMGLLMVLVAGAELFTGNTALVTAAVLEGKASLRGLAKSWVCSWLGNLVGSVALAWLTWQAGLLLPDGPVAKLAIAKTSMAFWPVRHWRLLCNATPCSLGGVLVAAGLAPSLPCQTRSGRKGCTILAPLPSNAGPSH